MYKGSYEDINADDNKNICHDVYICLQIFFLTLKELGMNVEVTQKRRVPFGATVIYSAGGYLKHSLSTLESFNPETGEWCTLKELPNPKSGAGAAFVGKLLSTSPCCTYQI